MFARLLNSNFNIQLGVAIFTLVGAMGVALILGWILLGNLTQASASLGEARERAGRMAQYSRIDLASLPTGELGNLDATALFMDAPSLVMARASLQERLTAIASTNNVIVASAGNVPDLQDGGAVTIGMRIDLSGSYEDVSRTVHSLESSVPPLIIRELTLRSAGIARPEIPPELAAQIRIYSAVRIADTVTADQEELAR